jgi:hypothetical protein
MHALKELWPLVLFNLSYIAAAVVGVMVSGNREFVFYLVVMAVLIAVVLYVHARINLPKFLLWALSLWGAMHMAGGLLPLPEGWPYNGKHAVLYSWWLIPDLLKYDQIVHAYGFGVTTWVCWHGFKTIAKAHGASLTPTFGTLTLCVAAGMGFGALNEIIEFIAVLSIPNTNVGGYVNTGWDLVANAVGAIMAAVLIRIVDFKDN